MPEAVVDELEVVEIHRQHRHGLVVVLVQLHGVHQPVVEQVAVRQPGECVAQRLVGDHLQQPLVLPHHHVLPRHHRDHQHGRRHEDGGETGCREVGGDAHHRGDGHRHVRQPHRHPRRHLRDDPPRSRTTRRLISAAIPNVKKAVAQPMSMTWPLAYTPLRGEVGERAVRQRHEDDADGQHRQRRASAGSWPWRGQAAPRSRSRCRRSG